MKKDNNLLDYVPRISEKLNWTEDDEHRVTVDVENKGVFNRIAPEMFWASGSQPHCLGTVREFHLETNRWCAYDL